MCVLRIAQGHNFSFSHSFELEGKNRFYKIKRQYKFVIKYFEIKYFANYNSSVSQDNRLH